MYDKRVRRRRAVLGLLVAASLVLLTAYFGESAAGPFHSIQRGVVDVFTPVQKGATKVFKPVSDLAGWFGDTLHARKQRDQLRKQRDQLLKRLAADEAALSENRQLKALVGLDQSAGLSRYRPVGARVIGSSPNVWYSTIEVDKGSGDGVRVDQPVVAGAGLVGKVTTVFSSSSVITLITDKSSGVAAKVLDGPGDFGVVVPEVGNPGRLLIQTLPPRAPVRTGDMVVTAGTSSSKYPSLFPPNIPIGTITEVSPGELALSQQAHLAPIADLRRVQFVQILENPTPGLRAQVP